MRLYPMMIAAFVLGCASRPKVQEKPMVVRVSPSGYQLVDDQGDPKQGKSRKVCQMEEIVGSHVPHLICYVPEDADAERRGTQMQWDQEHGCQYSNAMCHGN
jgi:hypothetical protein